MEKISLVITAKNEEKTVTGLFESVMSLTQKPDEIIIVDGGSEDNTVSVIESYKERLPQLKVIVDPGANISEGRNRGIKEARYDVIAVTDAGCRLDSMWLELLSAKLEPDVLWCTGDHVPDAQNEFEDTVGKCSTEGYFTVDSKKFKATARNLLFRKKVWEEVGGFPEELEISEDAFFILSLLNKGYKFFYVPEAIVYWRPRSSYKGIFKQFYNYAYWAARGGINLKIYWKPLLQQFVLVLSLVLWLLLRKIYLLLVGVGLVGAYFFRKFKKGNFGTLSLKKFFRAISIQTVIQLAISTGSLVGFLHRFVKRVPKKNTKSLEEHNFGKDHQKRDL
jgi:glycosyltransferase involved in cell wall biosynthesis